MKILQGVFISATYWSEKSKLSRKMRIKHKYLYQYFKRKKYTTFGTNKENNYIKRTPFSDSESELCLERTKGEEKDFISRFGFH